jgi:hypothetical protein
MNKEQALNVVKQALDQAIKIGVCPTIDTAAVLAQAYEILKRTVNASNSDPIS